MVCDEAELGPEKFREKIMKLRVEGGGQCSGCPNCDKGQPGAPGAATSPEMQQQRQAMAQVDQ